MTLLASFIVNAAVGENYVESTYLERNHKSQELNGL
jgi:hypothetical protein